MTIEAGAVAPVEGQTAVSAPAPAEPVIRDLDQVAEPEKTEQPPQEAKPEETNSETQEGDDSSQPKKLTRNQRLQRKAARLSTMLAEVSAENERLKTERTKAATEGEPKEADYNGDWGKFQAEYAAWKVTQNIRGDLAERDQRDRNAQLQDRIREATDDFLERVEDVKKSIPDYDKVVETFAGSGGKFAPHVIEEIRDSEKGPMLAYHFAKNPALAAELNALSPRDAAREIGRIEARLSLPQPRKQTQAPAPLTPVTGGATTSFNPFDTDDMEAYVKWRKKQG
jgi:flagellar motility protein MotE (MotC chaperone)